MLASRSAIVTGAGRGIGAAVSRLLAQHGAKVLVNDLDPAAAEETCAAIAGAGGVAASSFARLASPAPLASASPCALLGSLRLRCHKKAVDDPRQNSSSGCQGRSRLRYSIADLGRRVAAALRGLELLLPG